MSLLSLEERIRKAVSELKKRMPIVAVIVSDDSGLPLYYELDEERASRLSAVASEALSGLREVVRQLLKEDVRAVLMDYKRLSLMLLPRERLIFILFRKLR